ncbi:uncharacterized protein LOC129737807 [Uranotaenia lowii]|uniref:uncharacterized protein LOC129737807 n=1 Tax=Uranotaenia lowii TaxID=190385 RepID=UPI00247A9226|nr:uncharacterized protein LOC129737807 [Uranotaenia lowii]
MPFKKDDNLLLGERVGEKLIRQPVRPIYFTRNLPAAQPPDSTEITRRTRRRKVSTALRGQRQWTLGAIIHPTDLKRNCIPTVPVLQLCGCNRFRSDPRRLNIWRRNPSSAVRMELSANKHRPMNRFKNSYPVENR